MKEYMVISQSDKAFTGRMSSSKIEFVLNAYADLGWQLVSAAPIEFEATFSNKMRQEIMFILEREKRAQ